MSPDEPNPAGLPPEAPDGAAPAAPAIVPMETGAAVVAPTGKRPAFSKIRRELSEQDLATPGVQKMLLEELERAEDKLETTEAYLDKFHQADKEVGILTQQLKSQKASEVLFVAGVTCGSIMIGLGPSFWDTKWGWLVPALGAVLLVGALASRVIKYES